MIYSQTLSLKLCEIHSEKGGTVRIALSQTLLHWSLECAEGSIPFTRSTSPPYILNGLPMR